MDMRSLLSGIAIGAVAVSVLDPSRGARRRALLRDKAIRAGRITGDAFETTMRDLTNRTRGFAAETQGWIADRAVDDARLLERVRASLGRVSSHPRSVDVEVQGGQVTLRGPALYSEVQDLLSMAAGVRGVRSVINELEPHDSPGRVPASQEPTVTARDRDAGTRRRSGPGSRRPRSGLHAPVAGRVFFPSTGGVP